MNKSQAPTPADFAHIDTWVFDMDNTLYPHHSNLFSQIDVKMTSYVSELLDLPRDEARALQKKFYLEHGTTLKGLMIHHNINSDDFLNKVHDIDYSWLDPNPLLNKAIEALPGRKFIYTNGDRGHAERAAHQLGILEQFTDIFDIVAADLEPKPARAPYDKFVELHSINGKTSVFFEDLSRNLVAPKELGMKTVLIMPRNFEGDFVEAWEHDGKDSHFVDHVTDDLTEFLRAIMIR